MQQNIYLWDVGTILLTHHHSPAGELLLGSCGGKLCLCDWTARRRRELLDCRLQHHLGSCFEERPSPVTDAAILQLDEYFSGSRKDFDIPLLLTGTPFQQNVRMELIRIPYGSTVSYSELASRIGKHGAVRAVASAVASNPLSVFIPCHRVIGSDGSLAGYAGGLPAKRLLLSLENTFRP